MSSFSSSTFPALLRRMRKSLDLTQRELAQRVGCTEDLIGKIEAGRRRPSKQLAGLLAERLCVPAAEREQFMALAREMHTPPAKPDVTLSPATPLPPHALPQMHTRMFGRERDLARLVALLHRDDVRLITLTGTGGVGKTRLAIAAARETLLHFADGAWFAGLESLAGPALVTEAIAALMGAPLAPEAPPLAQAIAQIAGRHMLLVLDNFEHVLPAATDVLALLNACPNLRVLVTSRERLRLRAEHVMVVKSLLVPEENEAVDAIADAPAVQMFIDRATALDADFTVSATNAPALAALCRQLDGVPLAIELVAARAGSQPLAALATELQARVLHIDSDLRDLPLRQRSLWHAADWSYRLLNEDEQRCFRRLAALPAGATKAAATAVCSVPQLDPALRALIDKSLITSNGQDEWRCHMLMPLREFGLARLEEAGETAATQRAILAHFLQHAQSLYEAYFRNVPNIDTQWRMLDHDMDNLRMALRWADETNDAATFVRLSCAMRRFMRVRDHMGEGLIWARRAVALIDAGDPHMPDRRWLRADAHGALGTYLGEMGDIPLGMSHLRLAAEEARASGHDMRLISSLINLGYGLAMMHDYAAAREACEECLEVCARAGDRESVVDVRTCLGTIALRAQDWPEARLQLEAALAEYRASGNTSAAIITMSNLAVACKFMGDGPAALRLCDTALREARAADMQFLIGDITGNIVELHLAQGNVAAAIPHLVESLQACLQTQELESLANAFLHAADIAMRRSDMQQAARFLGAAQGVTQRRNAPFAEISQQSFDAMRNALSERLGNAALDDAMAGGATSDLQAQVDAARAWLTRV